MKKNDPCIICPNGCEIETEIEDGIIISVVGNTCKKGEEYVRQELLAPMRTIATSVLVKNGEEPLVSVRLTKPIPKAKIAMVMNEIKKAHVTAPVAAGSILIPDICGLGSDVIATRSVSRKNRITTDRVEGRDICTKLM